MLKPVGVRLSGTVGPHQLHRAGAAAALGGLLWVPYGVFEMLKPWGADTVYRDHRGYEVITDALLYRVYNVPGSLAVLLAALGLLGALGLPDGRAGSVGRILAYIALALAVLSAAGVGAQFDALDHPPDVGEDDLSFLDRNENVRRWEAPLFQPNHEGVFKLAKLARIFLRGNEFRTRRAVCKFVTAGSFTGEPTLGAKSESSHGRVVDILESVGRMDRPKRATVDRGSAILVDSQRQRMRTKKP